MSGAAASDLTGPACSPNGIHWTYDTYALANVAGKAHGARSSPSFQNYLRSLSEVLEKYIALLQPRKMASISNHEQCRVQQCRAQVESLQAAS
jgi:hypothetical protein